MAKKRMPKYGHAIFGQIEILISINETKFVQ